MELKQAFQEVSGQVSLNGRPFPLRGAKLKGDEIRFYVEGNSADRTSPLVFTGRIRGSAIEGTITADTTHRAWKAVRNPATMQPIDQ
jgi:hypothetical protein